MEITNNSTESIIDTTGSTNYDIDDYVSAIIPDVPLEKGKIWVRNVRCTFVTMYNDEEINKKELKKKYNCDYVGVKTIPRPIFNRWEILDIREKD